MRRGRKTKFIALVCLLLAVPLVADVLVLRNGKQVSGRFISVDQDGYTFETGGVRRKFPLADVARLTIEKAADKVPNTLQPVGEPGGRAADPHRDIIPFDEAFRRSMLFPGWGQIGRGRTAVGVAAGGLFLWSTFSALRDGIAAERYVDAYRRTARESTLVAMASPVPDHLRILLAAYPVVKEKRQRVEDARRRAFFWLGASAVLYGTSLLELRIRDMPDSAGLPQALFTIRVTF